MGFAQSIFIGRECSLCLGVGSELSGCKPERSQRHPGDGGASQGLDLPLGNVSYPSEAGDCDLDRTCC